MDKKFHLVSQVKTIISTLFISLCSIFVKAQASNAIEFSNDLFFRFFKIKIADNPLLKTLEEFQKNTRTVIDTSQYLTDNSSYFFKGYSTSFNPFDISTDTIAYYISEARLFKHKDSLNYHRRLLFQVVLYGDQSNESYALLIKEYKKLKKLFSANLKDVQHIVNNKNKYFISIFAFPFVTTTQNSIHISDDKDFPFLSINLIVRKDPNTLKTYLSLKFLTKSELVPE